MTFEEKTEYSQRIIRVISKHYPDICYVNIDARDDFLSIEIQFRWYWKLVPLYRGWRERLLHLDVGTALAEPISYKVVES